MRRATRRRLRPIWRLLDRERRRQATLTNLVEDYRYWDCVAAADWARCPEEGGGRQHWIGPQERVWDALIRAGAWTFVASQNGGTPKQCKRLWRKEGRLP